MSMNHSGPVLFGRGLGFIKAVFTALLYMLSVSAVSAQTQVLQNLPSLEESDSTLLLRIQNAARTLNYRGVFAYHQGGLIEASLITHVYDGKNETEKLELLDGPAREYLRKNDRVQSLIPEDNVVMLEKQRVDRFPGLLLSNIQAVVANYSIRPASQMMRVAGRTCQVIDVVPKDTLRYGYRLCVDNETRLLLRVQTVGDGGRLIEQVSFTQLSIGSDIPETLLAPSWSIADWKVVETQETMVDLQGLGWRIQAPAGYGVISQTQQFFAEKKRVHQMGLSDGLSTISIFIEPYLNERSDYKPLGAAQIGSVNLYGVKIANFWLTVLGEVPASTLEKFAQSIQYMPGQSLK